MKASRSYDEDLLEDLKDRKTAVGFLNAVLEEHDKDAFLIALKHVADAQGGITKLAKGAKMNRVNLYRMLTEGGNPELENLENILHALGFHLSVSLDKAA